ncbi:hypothetical protein [Methanobrevibacter curvatus]|uniref:Chromosome partition protein Smc n=1 Tax=Methanobrevibacter curvatus TaxID=49547 RepID=A0A166AGK8_9EURY|nr:hypothetical protein [Methanobrevibacter curvatus]KZX12008.1 hypothetical protein MBCUR_12140 [Methanobrevibacter curvatus]
MRVKKTTELDESKLDDDSNLSFDELKKEIKNLKEDLYLKEKERNQEIIKFNEKIAEIYKSKDEVIKELRTLETKEIDLKLKDFGNIQIQLQRLEHRLSLTQQSLEKAKGDIKLLKQIIIEFENQNLFNFISNKKPNSYFKYFKASNE